MAICDEIEVPEENKEIDNLVELPINIATAIVSPSALPSANVIAAMIPVAAAGKMARVIVSHLVAPSA